MKTATENSEKTILDVCRLASDLLGIAVHSAQRIGGSGNNRVYSLEYGNSRKGVAKFYFCHPADKRDRLHAEFSSLSFLWEQGMADIPQPIAVNREESCAIYGFIEGKKITPADTTNEDIVRAVDFLGRLKNLNHLAARSQNMPAASDACFSIQAILANVEGRLNRFQGLEHDEPEYCELGSFLQDDFKPFLSVLAKWAREQCAQSGISFDREISQEQKTLSPSDFGFHNALRAPDGRIVFLDFEYFGWDDPAKTVVDFLFHPAMGLSEPMKRNFVQGMLAAFRENEQLLERVRIVYPLFGMKWCMIFLNEFVPNDFSRRAFAAANPLDRSRLRTEQLRKAVNLCRKFKETYEDFSYAA